MKSNLKNLSFLTLCFIFSVTTLYAHQHTEWENQHINGVNRLDARAHSYSYRTVDKALSGDREESQMLSLNGEWSFLYVDDIKSSPSDFHKGDYDISKWDSIEVP